MANLAGCLAVVMQSFEWFMYAKLVQYQQKHELAQLEIQRQNFRSWETRFFKGFKIFIIIDTVISLLLEISCLSKGKKYTGVVIALTHWSLQIVVICIVFLFLRYQLLNYAFIEYEEHFKKLWLSFYSIIALSVFSIASECLIIQTSIEEPCLA